MLVSVESTDTFDSTVAVDYSDEGFATKEASHHKVLCRTTANVPLSTVQQTRGQEGPKRVTRLQGYTIRGT